MVSKVPSFKKINRRLFCLSNTGTLLISYSGLRIELADHQTN